MTNESLKEMSEHALSAWKKAYVDAILAALKPSGEILQVGFDQGHAASAFQKLRPKKHVIIECDPLKAKEAQKWAAAQKSNVMVIQDNWQTILPTLGIFDTIFFNDMQLNDQIEIAKLLNKDEIKLIANKTKDLLSSLREQLSQIKARYTNEEIDEFYEKIGRFNQKELPKFFKMLKEYGHITEEQYVKVIKKFHLENIKTTSTTPDLMLNFLEQCLKQHMHKGSRFSCVLYNPVSKYEDSHFFEQIITNPNADYHEKLVPLNVSNYKFEDVLVFVVEKLI